MDEYLTLARQYEDQETRAKYYDLFQEELAKDPAYAFICYIDANYVADSDIKGISKRPYLVITELVFSGIFRNGKS